MFKFFFLVGFWFDEFGVEFCGCVEFYIFFNDVKLIFEMKMVVKMRISVVNEIVYCMYLFEDGGLMGYKVLDLICKNLICVGVNCLSYLFRIVIWNILMLFE